MPSWGTKPASGAEPPSATAPASGPDGRASGDEPEHPAQARSGWTGSNEAHLVGDRGSGAVPGGTRAELASLAGRTVVVTRAQHQSGELGALLAARGAEVVELPTIAVVPVEDHAEVDQALAEIDRYRFLVLGSKNAAELFFARAQALGVAVPIAIACVGAKTRAYVEGEAWIRAIAPGPVIAPGVHRAEALVELLLAELARADSPTARRVLFPRAAEGRETIIEGLRAAGVEVDAPAIYRIAPAPRASDEVIAQLGAADVFTFLSGETLRAFLEVVPEDEARRLLAEKVVAVIGPVAKVKADALGIRVDVVPNEATIEALVLALSAHLGPRDV